MMPLSFLTKPTILVCFHSSEICFLPKLLLIDNVCIESLSVDLTRPMLESAARSVTKLGEKIEESVFNPLLQLIT